MIVPDPPRPAALYDEVMAETRRIKEEYAAEHGYDIAAIARDANEKARAAGVALTTPEPREETPDDAQPPPCP